MVRSDTTGTAGTSEELSGNETTYLVKNWRIHAGIRLKPLALYDFGGGA